MSEEITTWGKFETRSIVLPKTPVKFHYDPEIEKEMESYTVGKFVTRSIVRPKQYVKMYHVQPYLKVTLGLGEGAKLTYEQAMSHSEDLLASVIAAAPMKLQYSKEHSKVEDGKLIAALVPLEVADDTEWLIREFAEKLKDWPPSGVRPTTKAMACELEFLTVA